MDDGSYGQFCPVAMASEVLCSRWTTLVIRELLCGTTRFNDLRRGVPRMSPALLSKRLKELQRAGIILAAANAKGVTEYHLSPAGEDLRPVILGMGFWGQRWVESQLSLKNLDPSLLMWDMRRHLNPQPLPPKRCTIQFQYPELPQAKRDWWLVIDSGAVDLCRVNPGFEIDLLVTGSLKCMTAIWMGIALVQGEIEAGHLEVDGDPRIAEAMQRWLGLSPFAAEPRRVA
jgi:DNA-binding HxlR family transcriptional regulator